MMKNRSIFAQIAGVSLIEVLVSLFILSLIILEFDLLQLYSLRSSQEAYYFTVAENQLSSIAEKLQHSAENENITDFITQWNQQNKAILPKARGIVSGHYPLFKISLFWGENNHLTECDKDHIKKLKCLTEQISV